MSFLSNAIKNGIRNGISNAVSEAVNSAVKQVVEPKASELAEKAAEKLDQAAQAVSADAREAAEAAQAAGEAVNEAAAPAGGLESALAGLQHAMEGYANAAASNMKICPNCSNPATADKKFCPLCGAKLPDETLAQSGICPACGKQNPLGMKFCADCGTKLPFAVAEEKASADKNAAVLAKWAEKLPQYPVWSCGGTDFELEEGEGWFRFSASFDTERLGEQAVFAYRALLKQNGFREAGQYPDESNLYKKIDGVCYHVDTEHCFDGSMDRPDVTFSAEEPYGGFDYVKPEPKAQSGFSLKDLLKL